MTAIHASRGDGVIGNFTVLSLHRFVPMVILILAAVPELPGFAAAPYHTSHQSAAEGEVLVARVGDREITLRDFLERAEYTLRPRYCRGSSNNEKNIVLS